MEREFGLSEQSKITLGMCTAILALSFWMGVAWGQIAELREKMSIMQSIDQRLSRIEGRLGVKE